jgi:hypothetical protein
MTGPEALQALRDGKKVTNANMKDWNKAVVLTCEIEGYSLKRIAWVEYDRTDEDLEYAWEFSDPFNGSDFLTDDWEVVE